MNRMDCESSSLSADAVTAVLERTDVSTGDAARFRNWVEEEGISAVQWKKMLREVDESPYGFGDWVEASLFLRDRMVSEGRPTPGIGSVFGYVGCCCSLAEGVSVPPELLGVVKDALSSHGFSGEAE